MADNALQSIDIGSLPGLSVYMWQDGALFDRIMNQYMSVDYPRGVDPANPVAHLSRNNPEANLTSMTSTLSENSMLDSLLS